MARRTARESEEELDEGEDFDLDAEMEEGVVVSDARQGGYDVSIGGKHLDHTRTKEEALVIALEKMEEDQFYPNVFYVNDHGNVDLLSVEGKTRRGRIVGASYHIVRSWV
jgi:hypothetical protein